MADLGSQLFSMFLADEKKAILPDVQAFFADMGQNGVSIAGIPQLGKALTAVEADGISGIQQFAKDAGTLLDTYITTALTSATTTTTAAPAAATTAAAAPAAAS